MCIYVASCRLIRGSRRVSTSLPLSLYASPHWLQHTCTLERVCVVCACVYECTCVYVCVEVGYDARRRQSAFGRKQVPACRVPRGRLDSNTMEAGPWVRGCLLSSPFRYPLCVTLSLSPSTRSFSALRAPSAAYSLRHWLARPASVPFPPR